MSLTKVSFSMIAGSVANMLDYGIVGNGVVNDTASAQAALDSGASIVIVPPGYTIGVTGLTMAANQTLQIQGKIKMLSGVGGPVILVNDGCMVTDGEIDGNSVNCSGIAGVDKTNVTVNGVYVHNLGKVGIVSYKGTGQPENWRIVGNKVTDTGEQGISVEYTNSCIINDNIVNTALHGIQWWGGDSNVSQIKGIHGLRIQGNICSNVMGGIWGSLGANISVVNNHVENCSDVGIDFEGCDNFACTGNVAYECANGCYAIFFGCTNGTFIGNVGKNVISAGSGFYATTNSTYRNENIVISNNVFDVTGAAGIAATQNDGLSLTNCTISANRISSTTNSAISIFRNSNLQILNNTLNTINGIGVQFQGVSFSVISNNWLYCYSNTNPSPGSGGGIWLYQQSPTWSSQSNIIRNNRVEGYNYSIVDNCPSDQSKSKNDIEWNNVTNVYRSAGASYNGVISNNINYLTPGTAVTATTF